MRRRETEITFDIHLTNKEAMTILKLLERGTRGYDWTDNDRFRSNVALRVFKGKLLPEGYELVRA